MPKKESTQQKLSRVRPPRVHITYDVEVGGAIESKEIPFVVGVMGDYSGMPAESLPRVRDRKFIEIDRDNFDVGNSRSFFGIHFRHEYLVDALMLRKQRDI